MENIKTMKKQRSAKKASFGKSKPEKSQSERANPEKTQPERAKPEGPGTVKKSSTMQVHGISLDPGAARKAIILSEIIGPPVSRRRRRK